MKKSGKGSVSKWKRGEEKNAINRLSGKKEIDKSVGRETES